jgi:hypothetical protein
MLKEKYRISDKGVPEPWECLRGDKPSWNARVLRESQDAADVEMLGQASLIEGDRVNGASLI